MLHLLVPLYEFTDDILNIEKSYHYLTYVLNRKIPNNYYVKSEDCGIFNNECKASFVTI